MDTVEPEKPITNMTSIMRVADNIGAKQHFCPVTTDKSWPPKKSCPICTPRPGAGPAEE